MILDDMQAMFLEECEEQLAQIESVLLELSEGENPEAVNKCFRIFHSIKGGASMTGFMDVAHFTHHVETVLDRVRDGQLKITSELIAVVLASKDHIESLFAAARGAEAPPASVGEALEARLTVLAPAKDWLGSKKKEIAAAKAAEPSRPSRLSVSFSVRAGQTISAEAVASLIADLRKQGTCTVAVDTRSVAPIDTLVPSVCALTWQIELETTSTPDAVRDLFIFVEDALEVSIVESVTSGGNTVFESSDGSFAELFGPPSTPGTSSPDLSVASAPEPAASSPAVEGAGSPPVLRPKSAEKDASVGAKEAASGETKATGNTKAAAVDSMVRVSSSKLDLLVNLVSELVITQSRLAAVASRVGDQELAGPVEEVERLVSELREGVLGVRMMPIGSTFGRFKRLVHDLSGQLGKAVDLVTEGAETELDKSVLDQLVDPLLHLVRNSLDHGIEPTDVRIAAGKPERGTVRLVAKHAGQHVVVTIQDDGKGLDAEAIRAKAIQRGLISPDATLPQGELFKLIFLPGFSTAQALTSVSGRGVGMDVVKKQIEALRGSVRIHSERGVGTTMSLELPLTLAIIDGLLVEVGEDRYIMPLAAVTETVELPPDDRQKRNGNRVVVVREERVPYVSLRGVFDLPEDGVPNEKVVILETGEERVGLVVDRVLGGHQTVIQSLGPLYEHNRVVSGATIMGDGRVALILDVSGIVRVSRANDDSQGMILGRAA
jgi:two-component system chemotaxis sensor kinase CheA